MDSLFPPTKGQVCDFFNTMSQRLPTPGLCPSCPQAAWRLVLSGRETDRMGPVCSSCSSSLVAASLHSGADEPLQGLWESWGGHQAVTDTAPQLPASPWGYGEQLGPSGAGPLTPHFIKKQLAALAISLTLIDYPGSVLVADSDQGPSHTQS